jgi:hypothetical protein
MLSSLRTSFFAFTEKEKLEENYLSILDDSLAIDGRRDEKELFLEILREAGAWYLYATTQFFKSAFSPITAPSQTTQSCKLTLHSREQTSLPISNFRKGQRCKLLIDYSWTYPSPITQSFISTLLKIFALSPTLQRAPTTEFFIVTLSAMKADSPTRQLLASCGKSRNQVSVKFKQELTIRVEKKVHKGKTRNEK